MVLPSGILALTSRLLSQWGQSMGKLILSPGRGVCVRGLAGHASVSITLDIYSHVIPGMDEDAAKRIDAALRTHLEQQP